MKPSRFGFRSSIAMGAGILLSGPIGLLFVHLVAPQPAWRDADLFVAHYHVVQIVPYLFGLALVWGAAGVVVSFTERVRRRFTRTMARFAVAAFVTLISLNYILQTTYVPSLARSYDANAASAIEHLTMTNPHSLGWALEMWGYGFLGVATWLVAPSSPQTSLERSCAWLLTANGIVSVAGAIATMLRLEWVFSTPGFVAFVGWNVLMLALASASALFWRARSIARTRSVHVTV